MPYQNLEQLPNSVKSYLPKHAQEIFRSAFNYALDEYHQEEIAFRVAWSDVKRDFEKGEDGSRSALWMRNSCFLYAKLESMKIKFTYWRTQHGNDFNGCKTGSDWSKTGYYENCPRIVDSK
jgi:cation transport regulator